MQPRNFSTSNNLQYTVVNVIKRSQPHSETAFPGTMQLFGMDAMFKLDTGAEATAISEDTHSALGKPNLFDPSKILYGPGEQKLNVLGQFEVSLQCKQKSCKHQFFVIRGLKVNLLAS